MKLLLTSEDKKGLLNQKLKDVKHPKRVISVLKRMVKLMIKSDAVGLSSNQVGRTEKMFVFINTQREIEFVINPEILKVEKKTKTAKERCLSYPEMGNVAVTRPEKIKVRYHNGHEVVEKWLKGMGSRCFQHEMSHLEGNCPLGEVK